MRRQTPSPDHAAAVSQRLATLGAELDRVRGEQPPAELPEQDGRGRPDPPVVPVPGRHASRRTGGVGDVSSRLPVTSTHLVLLALVVAAALAVAAWLVLGRQASPQPLAPVTSLAGEASAPASTPASTPASSPSPGAEAAGGSAAPGASPVSGGPVTGEVTVDVAGKVQRPGIAVLPAGSRVVDAIEAAGGARPRVDLSSLNLARLLVDGEQVLVGVPAPAPPAPAAVGSAPAGGALVNLNTADAAALDTLPGVGPVTAEAILSWRSEHGGFTAVDELIEVDGIGDATLAEIAPHVTV